MYIYARTRARKPPFNPSFCKLRDYKIVLNIFTCKKNQEKVPFLRKKVPKSFAGIKKTTTFATVIKTGRSLSKTTHYNYTRVL